MAKPRPTRERLLLQHTWQFHKPVHVDATQKLSASNMETVTFAPSPRPPHDGAQTRMCVKTSTRSSAQAVNVEEAVPATGLRLGTDERGSLEYLLT